MVQPLAALLTQMLLKHLYDVLAYIAYAAAPISRSDRAIAHNSLIFSRYVGKQQEFLDFVLEQYVKAGVGNSIDPSFHNY